jgi:hypothetical protein
MATAAKTKEIQGPIFAPPPRLEPILRHPETVYMGACLVQANGAWTRSGPTWLTKYGWVIWGPGLRSWGTTKGLAELASERTPTPTWHAPGWSNVPNPNIVFYVEELGQAALKELGPYITAAECWMEEQQK